MAICRRSRERFTAIWNGLGSLLLRTCVKTLRREFQVDKVEKASNNGYVIDLYGAGSVKIQGSCKIKISFSLLLANASAKSCAEGNLHIYLHDTER